MARRARQDVRAAKFQGAHRCLRGDARRRKAIPLEPAVRRPITALDGKQTVSYGVRKSRGGLLGVYAKETRCPQRVGNILQGDDDDVVFIRGIQ